MGSRTTSLGLILLSVGLNAAAQIFLRSALRAGMPAGLSTMGLLLDVGFRPALLAGLACYGISLLTWLAVLSKIDASFAYPFLGLGFVFVAVASFFVLGEPFSARKIVGTLVIVLGVIVLSGG